MLISGNGQKQTYVLARQFGIHYIVVSFLELNRVYYNDCMKLTLVNVTQKCTCRCQEAGLNLAISRATNTFSQD